MTTISQERSRLAAVPGAPTLRRREQWGARFSYTNSRPVNSPATRVFVHITVTNPASHASNDAHARAIESIGISRFPATGISYNRLIMPSGALYEGQPMGRRGAHTVNDFSRSTCTTSGCPGRGGSLTAPSWNLNVNARSYVICQNVQHTVSDAQLDAVARAIAADKLAGLVTKNAAVHGHRCVSAKDCPGGRMWARMGELNQKVNRYVANGLPGSGGVTPTPPEESMATAKEVWNYVSSVNDTKFGTMLRQSFDAIRNKVAPNAWMVERWPSLPADGYTPRTYWRATYGHARKAAEESEANAKQLGKLAGELAGLRNAVEQMAAGQGNPVDMTAVQAAALAGAQQAMAELSITVTVEPAEEPTES